MSRSTTIPEVPGTGSARCTVGALAQRCGRRGFAIAYDLLRSPEDAEDAVQDALVRAYQALGDLRDPAAVDAWFYRSLSNGCLKVLRRRRVRARLSFKLVRRATQPEVRETQLLAALEALPPRQKLAVVLRHAHGFSVAEVASHLGVSHATAKTHLSRGLDRLRRELGVKP